MRRSRSARTTRRASAGARWRAWLGVVALLFYSALPLAHHARAAAPLPDGSRAGGVVYELCTPDGLRLVEVPPAGPAGKSDPAHRPYSCPICQTLQHAAALLPPALWTAPAPVLSAIATAPARADVAPRRLVVAVAQPRAPPSIA